MLRPSFIFNSDPRRYLKVLGRVLALLLAGLVAINATGYSLGLFDIANQRIYSYQMHKLQTLPAIDVAFVGDSSVGNSIDASLFEQLSGLSTTNLALNGAYGAGGAYNMLRKVVTTYKPRLAVIMLSLNTLKVDGAFTGYFFSSDPSQILTFSPIGLLSVYLNPKATKEVIEAVRRQGRRTAIVHMVQDYAPQKWRRDRLPPPVEVKHHPLLPGMVAPSQLTYINRAGELCRSHGITCVYTHGPIFEGYCRQAMGYIAEVDADVRAAGLTLLAGSPICMPEEDVGDSVNHPRPDLKQTYTRRYFDLLKETIDHVNAGNGTSVATASLSNISRTSRTQSAFFTGTLAVFPTVQHRP
jgi:hypothetical protein